MVNSEQSLAGELPTPKNLRPVWLVTEGWDVPGERLMGWEPLRTRWAGAEARLDLAPGSHLSQSSGSSLELFILLQPLPMRAKGRSKAKESRTVWGQERRQIPHLKVPLSGGGGLSSTRRGGWLGVFGAAGCERARSRGQTRGQGARGGRTGPCSAATSTRRSPPPALREPCVFPVHVSEAASPASRSSQAGTGLPRAPAA